MKFDDIKARWQGYSARKKWTIAGISAVLCIAVASGDHNASGGRDIGGGTADTGGYTAGISAPDERTLERREGLWALIGDHPIQAAVHRAVSSQQYL